MIPTTPDASSLTVFAHLHTFTWETKAEDIAGRSAPAPTLQVNSATGASAFSWRDGFQASLRPLQQLRDGWAGPNSRAVSPAVFYLVQHHLAMALARVPNPQLPYVVPTVDGGLQIDWHGDDVELEALFSPTGRITALAEVHSAGLEIEEEGDGAVDLLLRWTPRVAARSGDADIQPVAPPTPGYALAA